MSFMVTKNYFKIVLLILFVFSMHQSCSAAEKLPEVQTPAAFESSLSPAQSTAFADIILLSGCYTYFKDFRETYLLKPNDEDHVIQVFSNMINTAFPDKCYMREALLVKITPYFNHYYRHCPRIVGKIMEKTK